MTEEKRGRGRPKGSKNRPKDDAAPGVDASKVSEPQRVSVEDLTEDQHLCLILQHDRRIASAEAALKMAQTAVKNARNAAKGELGPDTVKQILLYRSLQTEYGQTALKSLMGMQAMTARWAGMPVGHVDDMFDTDRTPSVDRAFEDGKRAGMAGDAPAVPQTMGVAQGQEWLKGWHAGQAINLDLMRNMPKPKGRDLDEGEDAPNDHYSAGYAARERDEGGVIPDGLNANEGAEWLRGWSDRADEIERRGRPIDYHAMGRAAFEANLDMVVPETVPPHEAGHWRTGWQLAARKSADAKRPSVAA